MTYLAYDTETTGLPLFKERSHDPRQPHIVSLALVMHDDTGKELSAREVIVRPDGWTIPPDTIAIHGITQERAMEEGIPEDHAVALFLVAAAKAEIRIAHNGAFDTRILRIAMTRAGYQRPLIEFLEAQPSFDTCRASQAIVNLPPTDKMMARGMSGPKPPTLNESMRHFFPDEHIEGLHTALADARHSGRLYFHLKSLEKGTN